MPMNNQELYEFYEECAKLLETTHSFNTPYSIQKIDKNGEIHIVDRTRWGPREPGNGRFPGHGTIRVFGSIIQVSLYNPRLVGIYNSQEEVLKELLSVLHK